MRALIKLFLAFNAYDRAVKRDIHREAARVQKFSTQLKEINVAANSSDYGKLMDLIDAVQTA